jgi:hypothetical protein
MPMRRQGRRRNPRGRCASNAGSPPLSIAAARAAHERHAAKNRSHMIRTSPIGYVEIHIDGRLSAR